MTDLPRKYIVDEHDRKVAVQLDIDTFQKIEELLENHGLVELMKQNERQERLAAPQAQEYYKTLGRAE